MSLLLKVSIIVSILDNRIHERQSTTLERKQSRPANAESKYFPEGRCRKSSLDEELGKHVRSLGREVVE
jgi:hypothetical protein